MSITQIFDQYGHPTQPFWYALHQNLVKSGELQILVLSDKIHQRGEGEIKPLRLRSLPSRVASLIRYFQLNGNMQTISPQLFSKYPNFFLDQNQVIHFLNAQQYPTFSRYVSNKKLIFSFRGYETLVRPDADAQWLRELKKIYQEATLLQFVSNHIQQKAIELGAPKEKCKVIYRSVDLDFFTPDLEKRKHSETLNILTIGRLTWQKGYLNAIECIKKLVEKGLPLQYDIIGTGPDLQELLFHCKRLELEKNINFHGQLNREQIKEKLNYANVYFQPSVTEALPNAILEASAMELPVVSTNAGGIPEAVQHGKTGLLAPIADIQLLTEYLADLLLTPDKAQEMGKAGRLFMNERFHPSRELAQWISTYQKVLD